MKILFVTTVSNTVNAFLVPYILDLVEKGHTVDVAFNLQQEVNAEIIKVGCKVHNIEFQRSPASFTNIVAYKTLKKIIRHEQYEIIHTHTPVASVCVRLACRELPDVKVIYTAHGFHFFKGAPIINWMLYYPLEKWLSKITDLLINVNREDFNLSTKRFKTKKIRYIPGIGVDTKRFSEHNVKPNLRELLGIPNDAFVVLSVGELNDNKNHNIILKAISELKYYTNVYYVICGEGNLENQIRKQAEKLNLQSRLILLGFRKDVENIYKIADLFAFPSKREGLGLAAIEAMAAGLPIITSNVHGIVDYSINGETGFSCAPNNIHAFSKAIRVLFENEGMRKRMGLGNVEKSKQFDQKKVRVMMSDIYEEFISYRGNENGKRL